MVQTIPLTPKRSGALTSNAKLTLTQKSTNGFLHGERSQTVEAGEHESLDDTHLVGKIQSFKENDQSKGNFQMHTLIH